jgi:hypothetical protein
LFTNKQKSKNLWYNNYVAIKVTNKILQVIFFTKPMKNKITKCIVGVTDVAPTKTSSEKFFSEPMKKQT